MRKIKATFEEERKYYYIKLIEDNEKTSAYLLVKFFKDLDEQTYKITAHYATNTCQLLVLMRYAVKFFKNNNERISKFIRTPLTITAFADDIINAAKLCGFKPNSDFSGYEGLTLKYTYDEGDENNIINTLMENMYTHHRETRKETLQNGITIYAAFSLDEVKQQDNNLQKAKYKLAFKDKHDNVSFMPLCNIILDNNTMTINKKDTNLLPRRIKEILRELGYKT